jgi:hypothetical protein
MKTEHFNDEPLSDKELFAMLRESFSSDEDCWLVVKEAQQSFKELKKQLVMLEIEQEREERNQFGEDFYAA